MGLWSGLMASGWPAAAPRESDVTKQSRPKVKHGQGAKQGGSVHSLMQALLSLRDATPIVVRA